jgi:hypothetical protein
MAIETADEAAARSGTKEKPKRERRELSKSTSLPPKRAAIRRLAEALRANLGRRKAQIREQKEAAASGAPEDENSG